MRRFSLLLVVLASICALSSCDSPDDKIILMFVAPQKGACGDGDLCLIVRDEGDEAFRLLDHIEAFRFRWGYEYQLRVQVKLVRTFGPIPTTTRLVLKDVEERDEVAGGTSFELCMVPSMIGQLDLEGNRGWIGEEQREFEFTDEQEALLLGLQDQGFGRATFAFQEDVDDPMVLMDLALDLEAPCEGPLPEYVPEPGPTPKLR